MYWFLRRNTQANFLAVFYRNANRLLRDSGRCSHLHRDRIRVQDFPRLSKFVTRTAKLPDATSAKLRRESVEMLVSLTVAAAAPFTRASRLEWVPH